MSSRLVSRLLSRTGWALLLVGLAGVAWSVWPIPRERLSLTVQDGAWELAWDAPRWLRAGEPAPVRLEAEGLRFPEPSASEGEVVLVAELHAGGAVIEPAPVLVTPFTNSDDMTFAWTIQPPLTDEVQAELQLQLQAADDPSLRQLVWGRSMLLPVASLSGFTAPAARAAGVVGVLAGLLVIILGARVRGQG